MPRAPEHGGRGLIGEAAADDRNIGVLHEEFRPYLRKFCAPNGLAGKNWNQKIVFRAVFTRVKYATRSIPKRAGHRHFGFSDVAANAKSTGPIGVSSVLVLLDLAIHRL